MRMADILAKTIDKSAYTKSGLARKLAITPQSVAARLNPNKDVGVAKALEVLGELGYEMMVVPGGTRLPQGGFRVTNDSSQAPSAEAKPKRHATEHPTSALSEEETDDGIDLHGEGREAAEAAGREAFDAHDFNWLDDEDD